jgi:hypothetical protein
MPIRGQSLALQWLAERPDTEVCAAVRGILVRAVWSFYEQRAEVGEVAAAGWCGGVRAAV